ncbi:MAG: CotH kinase family protein [Muribaculaceae bacterium]|nr:CotH kinase family protein [Muribaculaceae bacterium]
MKRLLLLTLLLVTTAGLAVHAQDPANFPPDDQTVVIDSTNLPIVWIDVDGVTIQREDYVSARMKIIHNGQGQLNYGDTIAHPGQHIDYEGYIALRYRGNSSYSLSDKKPYQFRTLSKPLEDGVEMDKKKVSILGMGKDNKWAMLAPYSDRSMIRDLLGFEVARPWMEYTPQGRLCEVYLDGIYYGIFVMCEVVSKGKYRLNLDDPGEEGDALTGGYLMEVGAPEGPVYVSKYRPVDNNGYSYNDSTSFIYFQYQSPDYEDMTPAQIAYIHSAIDEMESLYASSKFRDPVVGYRRLVDVQSFMDYQLTMEVCHNMDAYRLSGKFYKRRDSVDTRFKMVVWDMNLAFGNCRHNQGYMTNTWVYRLNPYLHKRGDHLIPFWWYRMNIDKVYVADRKARWAQWREANLQYDRFMATVDSLANEVTCCGAEARNTQAWPRWGTWLWPNYFVANSYEEEITFMKEWITERIAWMDAQLGYTPPAPTYEPGDVNGDGQINISDVNELINIILNGTYTPEEYERSDYNGDKEVNISDVMELINYILNTI